MGEVIHRDFSAQVVHIVEPDDDDWKPLCGTKNASVVMDRWSKLTPKYQWCPACERKARAK